MVWLLSHSLEEHWEIVMKIKISNVAFPSDSVTWAWMFNDDRKIPSVVVSSELWGRNWSFRDSSSLWHQRLVHILLCKFWWGFASSACASLLKCLISSDGDGFCKDFNGLWLFSWRFLGHFLLGEIAKARVHVLWKKLWGFWVVRLSLSFAKTLLEMIFNDHLARWRRLWRNIE